MNAYLIAFDTNITPVHYAHEAITKSQFVNEWWHYLNGVYIVKSDANLTALTNSVRAR